MSAEFSTLSFKHKLGALRLTAHLVLRHWAEAELLHRVSIREFMALTASCDKCVSIMRFYE